MVATLSGSPNLRTTRFPLQSFAPCGALPRLQGILLLALPVFAPARPTVKIFDWVTRRYYVGEVKTKTDSALEIELPASARLHVGQRVRFVVAGQRALVARADMQTARITRATPLGSRLRIDILPLAD